MRNFKKLLLSILTGLIALSLAVSPALAALNGTGGIGVKPYGTQKAWYNLNTDEGYKVTLYLCKVLGSAGHTGAVFSTRDYGPNAPLVKVGEVYVMGTPTFHDASGNHNLLGTDAIIDPAIRPWSASFKGRDILQMFEDLGIDHILSWFEDVDTRLGVRWFLNNRVQTVYIDAEMQHGFSTALLNIPWQTSQVGDTDKLNWYIRIEPFVVFRGLGPNNDEWSLFTCDDIAEAQGNDYNFLSNTSAHRNCGYDTHWISENGLPNNYTYYHSARAGYKEVYTGGLPGEAVQSVAFSILPNSLFFEESWLGEESWYDTHTEDPTAYWSLNEVKRFGGRGWLSMEGATGSDTPELSMVQLIAGEGIESVTLDDWKTGTSVGEFYGGENGDFGEFS